MATLSQFLFLALLFGSVIGLDNGVARTPPMGWNSYNAYACETTDVDYIANAAAMVGLGLKDAGYHYINMDCGWQSDARSSSGTFMWNSSRISIGVPTLANHVHSLGLGFGVYSDAGYYSCDDVNGAARWIGSRGYEQSDAATFAEWGADYLKYDNCFVESNSAFASHNPSIQEQPLYTTMRDALNDTGRSILFSICEWGMQDPARWAGAVGNSWRMSNDNGPPPSFESLKRIINQLVPITKFAGPGAWNDLDLLEVGNQGLTAAEWKMQFMFWAAAKSPLIISTPLTNLPPVALDILTHKEMIAVNQDALGQSIEFKRRYTGDYDVWAGNLSDGSMISVLVNWQNHDRMLPFHLADVGLVSATMANLWTGAAIGDVDGSYTSFVEAHCALMYKLTNGKPAAPYEFKTYFANAPSNTLKGGAKLRSVSDGVTVAGDIGYTGSVTFHNVDGGANGGTKLLSIQYINADFTFDNTACSNCRMAQISVSNSNGVVNMVPMEMPLSGQSWDMLSEGYLVTLDGFVAGTSNEITFGNAQGWAPDLYSISVQV